MSKYISEKTLRTIQIRYAITERQQRRQLWIQLACEIMSLFDSYCLYRNAGAPNEDVTVEEWEEILPLFNKILGTEFNLSNFIEDPDKKANEAILCYNSYKKLLKIFDGKLFKASVAEKLFPEMYDDFENVPANILNYHYYGKIADVILGYMCEKFDYDTFIQKVLDTKIAPKQKPFDSTALKEMIAAGEKWVPRYLEILEEEKAKEQI